MPESSYRSSIKRALLIDEGVVRAIERACSVLGNQLNINVSFSDDTTTTFGSIDDAGKVANAPSRRIQSISLECRAADHKSNADVKIHRNRSALENIEIYMRGAEPDVLMCRRNVIEVIDNATCWYTWFHVRSEVFIIAFYAIVLSSSIAGLGILAASFFANLNGHPPELFFVFLGLALPLASLFLISASIAMKKAFPLTVFRFGNEYDSVVGYRSMLTRVAASSVAAIGLASAIISIVVYYS